MRVLINKLIAAAVLLLVAFLLLSNLDFSTNNRSAFSVLLTVVGGLSAIGAIGIFVEWKPGKILWIKARRLTLVTIEVQNADT